MHGYINTLVGIFAALGNNEYLVVFGTCYYLHAGIAAAVPVDNYFNLIDTIIVLGKLGGLFLGVMLNSFRYLYMFAANSKKQSSSP